MGGGVRMGNGGFHIAQIACAREQLHAVHHMPSLFTRTFHFKSHHHTKHALLLFCQLMLRMAFQAAVIHFFNLRMLFQPLRQSHGIGTFTFQTHKQGFQAAGQQPCIEWGNDFTRGFHMVPNLLYQGIAAANNPTYGTAVAVYAFGSRSQGNVCTQLNRLLHRRGTETIVND